MPVCSLSPLFPHLAARLVSTLAVLALVGCTPAPTPSAAPPPLRAADLEGEIVRLAAEEAARIAAETREDMSVRFPDDLSVALWAPEQLLEDPIALTVDGHGHAYVTGSARTMGLLDIRGHPTWPIPALAMRTVEDYRTFLRRELAPERSEQNAAWLPDLNEDGSHDWRDLTVRTETVYRLVDTTGDGRADLSQVMIEGFNSDELTDVAGGLLVHDGDLYLGVAPDLWLLRDTTGNGVIDVQESISHGYGVHPGFNGHGVSGVITGPDGRIYWAVGDMGFSVVDGEGRRWEYPLEGAILRSEPDGSGFEVFATGLRNTHEFVFDEYGNLISVDNDGDHPGEHERLVYLVDGSDSGWRVNWQFGKYTDPDNNPYNVWMDERLFRPRFEGQAAYITPPVAAYHAGPAGMAYNPGTALSERWRNHFFVAAFHGSPANSRVEAFQLAPQGAGFELTRDTVVVHGILVTGMEFGPDGALYLADWVQGWRTTGTGRIWRVDAPEAADNPERVETRELLGEGFAHRSPRELSNLLRHADMRVRLQAQFALADRSAQRVLLAAARQRDHRLARVHGIWGIGQLARGDHRQAAALTRLLRDDDAEVRAQAAKVLGDVRYAPAADALLPLLRDPSLRVRFFAAEALGRIGHAEATGPLVAMLEDNDDADVYLRHAGALAMARIGRAQPVASLAEHPSRGVRIAAVVALRRMRDPGVARFLYDADEYVVAEAARAINDDGGIEAAYPALARVLEQPRFSDPTLLRRAINANLRIGTAEAAQRVARFTLRTDAPEEMRVEGVDALAVWPQPSLLDRVDGIFHGPVERDPEIARGAVLPLAEPLLAGPSVALRLATANAAGRLGLEAAVPMLMARLAQDPAPGVRVAALRALHAMDTPRLENAVRIALDDPEQEVRTAAFGLVVTLGLPEEATADLLAAVFERGAAEEQQAALAALGGLDSPGAHRVLRQQLERLAAGTLPPEIQLDVVEAVEASRSRELRTRLTLYQQTKAAHDPVEQFIETLHGGNAAAGRRVFFQSPSGMCTQCHAIQGRGGASGPDLTRVGERLSRRELLQALVDPNARIAPGYGIVSLTLASGERLAGTLREESPTHLLIETPTGESRHIAKSDIAQRTNPLSGMPPMNHLLSRRELRDLVEYLSTLR